jgi:2-desacetyl-2-hydroxyethyl bacteriochlorophyllide A dehydrogenase
MLAVRKTSALPGISLDQIEEPASPGAHEVLIEVAAAGICGSDVHVYEWTRGYEFMQAKLPVTLGHEFSGRIVKTGSDVTTVSVGDLVTVVPTTSCMRCAYCAGGTPNLCTQRQTIGLTANGAFARFVLAPSISCLKLAPDTDPVLAALIEPLAVGDHAANVGEVKAGDTVVILGPGTIGQAIACAAKWRGALKVIVVGLNDAPRLEIARAMGATHTIDLADTTDLSAKVLEFNAGHLADVVIEATGHPSSLQTGLDLLRRGGILVTAGIHSVPVSFDLTRLVRNSQQIRGAHGSRRHSWEIIARRLAQEPDVIRPMVSLELGLQDAAIGFEKCLAREVSKVILRPSSFPV